MLMHERDTTEILRKRFTHALLLAAGAGVIWYFGVQPLEKTYASQRENKELMQQKLAAYGNSSSEDKSIDESVKSMNSMFDSVNHWTAGSADPAELYESINSLASKHHVTIERIEPSTQQDVIGTTTDSSVSTGTRRGRRASATPTSQDKTKWRARTMSHRMSVTGSYQDICDFVGACERELGASKVRSIAIHQSMNLNDSGNRVGAEIETVHLELRKPELDSKAKLTVSNSSGASASDATDSDPLPQETPK